MNRFYCDLCMAEADPFKMTTITVHNTATQVCKQCDDAIYKLVRGYGNVARRAAGKPPLEEPYVEPEWKPPAPKGKPK